MRDNFHGKRKDFSEVRAQTDRLKDIICNFFSCSIQNEVVTHMCSNLVLLLFLDVQYKCKQIKKK